MTAPDFPILVMMLSQFRLICQVLLDSGADPGFLKGVGVGGGGGGEAAAIYLKKTVFNHLLVLQIFSKRGGGHLLWLSSRAYNFCDTDLVLIALSTYESDVKVHVNATDMTFGIKKGASNFHIFSLNVMFSTCPKT